MPMSGAQPASEVRWTEHKGSVGIPAAPSGRVGQRRCVTCRHVHHGARFVADGLDRPPRTTASGWINEIGSHNAVKADLENQKFVLPEALRMQLAKQNRIGASRLNSAKTCRQHTSRRWADPELRKPMLAGLEQGNGFYKGMPSVRSPEQIADHRQVMKELWADPERSAKLKARRNRVGKILGPGTTSGEDARVSCRQISEE